MLKSWKEMGDGATHERALFGRYMCKNGPESSEKEAEGYSPADWAAYVTRRRADNCIDAAKFRSHPFNHHLLPGPDSRQL